MIAQQSVLPRASQAFRAATKPTGLGSFCVVTGCTPSGDDDRFRIRLLYPVRGLAVVPKDHKFSRRRTIEAAELADQPLLLLRNEFASRDWVETACRVARIRPRVLLESGAPHTAIALADAGYGIAVVPFTVLIPAGHVRGIPLLQRGAAVGRWLRVAWQPERFLSAYAQQFIDELWRHCQREYPGREFNRRATALPRSRSQCGD